MKLFLVERTDNYGYDEYSDFVCWANSEEEARGLHPYGDETYVHLNDGWHMKYSRTGEISKTKESFSSWPHDITALEVKELSIPPEKPAVVLASFHAG